MKLRFAPSPTGYLHVGGLRTALFNYLLARQSGGTFLLRIEDTDQSRRVEGAVENLIDSLRWAGIDYDEGPEKDQGNGPYFQSQRLEIYMQFVEELLAADHAYPCFCTSERLDQLRKEQQSRNLQTRYDGLCRALDREAAHTRMQTEAHVIRMKIPQNEILEFEDLVRGRIKYPLNQIDDQILLKADRFPTYHLANVVDDHLMGVDTVVRGEEWLPSTPKHILLYRYLGWELPEFAHLPLLLNPDRSKLSKRQGDVAVEDYRDRGFLPAALINFVALLGWNPGDDRELFEIDELIKTFSLERVNKAGAVFDLEKLNWMNGQYIRQLSDERYLQLSRAEVPEIQLPDSAFLAVRTSLNTWQDLARALEIFRRDSFEPEGEEARKMLELESSRQVFRSFLDGLAESDLNAADFRALMKRIQKETGVKGKFLWMPMRIALTGQTHGPELPFIVETFGPDKVRERLNIALGQ